MCHSESGRWCYRINPQEKPIWIIYTFYNEDIDQKKPKQQNKEKRNKKNKKGGNKHYGRNSVDAW